MLNEAIESRDREKIQIASNAGSMKASDWERARPGSKQFLVVFPASNRIDPAINVFSRTSAGILIFLGRSQTKLLDEPTRRSLFRRSSDLRRETDDR